MEQMIASWSMVMVHGLMVAGPGLKPKLARCSNRKINEAQIKVALLVYYGKLVWRK